MLINQQDNYNQKFGEVIRSSGIFLYKYDQSFSTTISFMNYWKIKRDLKVGVIASLRSMEGTLLLRERLDFNEGNVINYRPTLKNQASFMGSVEIEIFSASNMVIPYAAIMVIYEAPGSCSFVHTYGRTYSRYEVEEKNIISEGHEACWILKDDDNVVSKAYFHNGAEGADSQDIKLNIKNHENKAISATIKNVSLKPFETYEIAPNKHFPDLVNFLDGKWGSCSISFSLNQAFTRALLVTESKNAWQVTHSNFDYSKHNTDLLEDPESQTAYMFIPQICPNQSIIVYPDSNPGNYSLTFEDGRKIDFDSGTLLSEHCSSGFVKFARNDGHLPSRIVTAISGHQKNNLPFECSLGVLTKRKPPKHFWWGLIGGKSQYSSRLFIHDNPEVYGEIKPTDQLEVSVVSKKGQDTQVKTFNSIDLDLFKSGVEFKEIFTNIIEFLDDDFGYYLIKSSYPGFTVYSSLESETGAISFEHGF
ncbi:MAG: hypothetical protein AB8G05_08805 [Oligoflexales bacterium]